MTSSCSPERVSARPGSSAVSKDAGLAALRRHIAVLERRSPGPAHPADLPRPWQTGVAALDGALPADRGSEPAASGLILGGVHEAAGASPADRPAALAFLAALLARLGRHGPVAVCQGPGSVTRLGRLYGPGWRDLGADPAEPGDRRDPARTGCAVGDGGESAQWRGCGGSGRDGTACLRRQPPPGAGRARERDTLAAVARRWTCPGKRRLFALACRGVAGFCLALR